VLPLLLAGGAMVVPHPFGRPGGFGAPNLVAGAVLTTVAAFTLQRLTRHGVATLTAITVIALIAAVVTAPLADSQLRPGQVTPGAVLGGLLLLGIAPRIAVLVARIRPPDLPDPGDEVSPVTLNQIFDEEGGVEHEPDLSVERRARLAVTTLIGLVVASCVVVPVGAIATAAANPGGVLPSVLAATVTLILALRARAFPDRVQAIALMIAAVTTWLGVGFVLVIDYQSPVARLVVVAAVVAVLILGALAAVGLPGQRLSPVTRRLIDMIEFALIIVVPILCFVVMGVYAATRRV
jgi:type VII secretion integral membrane protein EccD